MKSNVVYKRSEGHKYNTDQNGRIATAELKLVLGKRERNPYSQKTVGGKDRFDSTKIYLDPVLKIVKKYSPLNSQSPYIYSFTS